MRRLWLPQVWLPQDMALRRLWLAQGNVLGENDATFALRNGAKRQARDAMKDRVEAPRLDRDYPIRTRDEILTKYGGDFDKAIAASKRSNPDLALRRTTPHT